MKKFTLITCAFTVLMVLASSLAFSQAINTPIDEQSEKFTATFDVTPSVAPLNAGVGFSNGEVAGWGDMSAIIGFTPAGEIRTRNGGVYQQLEIMNYEAAKAYHIVMTIDVPNQLYSATITPDGGVSVVMAYEFGYRKAAETMNNYFTINDSIEAWGGVHDATLDISNFMLLDSIIEISNGIQVGTVLNIPIAPQKSRFTAECNIVASDDNMNGAFALSADTAAAWSDLSAIVRFGTNGFIQAYNGTAYEALTEYAYSKDRVYALKLEVDVMAQTYSVSVTGDDKTTVQLASDYAFRAPAEALSFRVAFVDTVSAWGGIPGSSISVNNYSMQYNAAKTKIFKTTEVPTIDGDISDGFWDTVEKNENLNNLSKAAESAEDLSGYWKAVWTSDALYVMVDVTDDILFDNGAPDFNTDGVHFYWGLANNRNGLGANSTSTTDPADNAKVFGQFYYTADGSEKSGGEIGAWMPGVEFKLVTTATGYIVEASFAWADIARYGYEFNAEAGEKILFDVDIIDSDNDGWYSEMQWSSTQNNWNIMDEAGEVELAVNADNSALTAVIDSCNAVIDAAVVGWAADEYGQETIDAALAAVASAEGSLNTPENYDTAIESLRIEMVAFKTNYFDYTALNTAIDDFSAMVSNATISDEDGAYSQSKVNAANEAIAAAESVLGGAFSQVSIDNALAALNTAMEAFVPNDKTGSAFNYANLNIEIYPNPVNNTLSISNVEKGSLISVYSTTGSLFMQVYSNEESTSLDVSELKSGVYIISLISNNGVASKQFIKK